MDKPHHRAKLTEAQVVEIRERHAKGESQNALARAYLVSQPTIGQIVHYATWRRVDKRK